MQYALDANGKKVHHYNADSSIEYKCPDCLDTVYIRKGLNACFYHKPIHDRTPLQRTCPEYHENNKIENNVDKLYINNGGVPLYLCSQNDIFELRAYFPSVSVSVLNELKKVRAKVHINTNAKNNFDRVVYSIDNLNYYRVTTIEPWIDIKCEPEMDDLLEIKRKWLWGIRGIDIKNDLYHSCKNGGYRLAIKSDVYVGKSYRIILNKIPSVCGIEFTKTGSISLRKSLNKVIYSVYEMKVEFFTKEAQNFIEGKGYKLCQKADELIPVWPPSIFTGNDLTFNQREAFLLHLKNSSSNYVYCEDSCKVSEISKKKDMIKMFISNNNAIGLSNGKSSLPEIKYNILYNHKLLKKPTVKLNIVIKDNDENEFDFLDKNQQPPEDSILRIESNVKFIATVSIGNYVLFSSRSYLEFVNYYRRIVINSGAFGFKQYLFERNFVKKQIDSEIDWEQEYKKLYICCDSTVSANNKNIMLMHLLLKNLNESNKNVFRLVEKWIKTNSVPVSAIKYLDNLMRRLLCNESK
ncbi:hypothetical protein RBH29_02020 [Herbivorax sp. ANBcel31]|uniref:hypothetical protein n=1 Tax=Herbivorax sp. ANBcel31 TaxID=3069754 RepID=UPI0027B5AD6C|nr:hypothetical protein [Herbivorax sp. ANBcel31]MDQ2085212.1 hypothetical protein [Herbivorax sp. ANBcel31]